jgi:ABC-2 type transport system ATP-binding protein
MKILEASGLSKVYGKLKSVDDLSLEVREGEIYGLLGLNGAGKTTTIRMFLDLIKPSSGIVRLFGQSVRSGDVLLNSVGYLVETPSSYPELTVVENLQLYYKYRRLADPGLIESIIHKLQLGAFRNVKTKNLSLGNKQRLGLAKALFHKPRLLILDEPTNGLDPAGIVEFRNLLKTLSTDGTTIFISSHLLDEVSRVASRIGIVHEGKLIREVNSAGLDEELKKTLVIKTGDIEQCSILMSTWGYEFSKNTQTNELRSDSRQAVDDREQIAKRIVDAGLGLKELYVERENLEAYFLRQIGKDVHHE